MEEPATLPEYTHLPTDALCVVLQHLFAPAPGELAVPLSEFTATWHAVCGTCQHWRQVLLAHPPPLYLSISTLPEDWVHRWLPALPLRALCVEQGLDPRWSRADEDEEEGDAAAPQQGGSGPPASMPNPVGALQLVASMEGAGVPRPHWSPATWSGLQVLHLQAPLSAPDAPAVFDSASLQGLAQLADLSLGSWADFQLAHLPPALRRLRLRYDAQTRTLSVPALPEHIRRVLLGLERLRLEKPGALGVCIDDWWGKVDELDIASQELLLGVPVDDKRLIATFERPYREGNFVPPHIWGDEEADDNSKAAADMAANHFLAVLPACPRLQRLRLAGGAAASLKFMPVLPHARASLQWLWSVVRLQGMHNCLGLSGREMEARQQLFEERLRFHHSRPTSSGATATPAADAAPGPRHPAAAASEPYCCIEILRGGLAPAGPEADAAA